MYLALGEKFINNYSYDSLLVATDEYSRVSKQLKFFKVFNPSLNVCWVIEEDYCSKYQVRQRIRDHLATSRDDFKVIDGLLANQFIVIASSDVMACIKLLGFTSSSLQRK